MDEVVVDSSVMVKWFVDEPGSEEARNLLKKHQDKKIKITVPDFILTELLNALFFSHKFDQGELLLVIKAFYLAKLNLQSIKASLYSLSSEIMDKFKIASYDAVFIALAEKENCTLITEDRKHHRKKYSGRIKYLPDI